MITFSKYKSSVLEAGKRIIKAFQFGAKTAKECYPFGFDSNPLENYTAIYLETSNSAEAIIIGYINRSQIAKPGESRMFALGSNGELLGYVYARDTGVLELSGNGFSAVRFQPLNTNLQNQVTAINAELIKIQTAITALGGTYIISPISLNITTSESTDVKLK